MIDIEVLEREFWDEEKQEFVKIKAQTIVLEHSLVSISKWESVHKIPFIGEEKKTREQLIDYIKFMTITQNVDPNIYGALTKLNIKQIEDYIADKRSATWFNERKIEGVVNPVKKNKEAITSELIYYWMVAYQIPFECQKWHLNRLLNLIKICDIKNRPAKKQNKRETLSNNARLNAERRKALNTTG